MFKTPTILSILILLLQILSIKTQDQDDENKLYSEFLRLNSTYTYSHLVSKEQVFWWSISGTKILVAVYGPGPGYVAAGFSPKGSMVGSVAVIGINSDNPSIQMYYLGGQEPDLVTQLPSTNLLPGKLTYLDGTLILEFKWDTIQTNPYYNFSINDDVKMIWSYKQDAAVLDYHTGRTPCINPLNFVTGKGAIPYTTPECGIGVPGNNIESHVFTDPCQCRGFYQPPDCFGTNLTNSHSFMDSNSLEIVKMNWYVVNGIGYFDVLGTGDGWIGVGFCKTAQGLMDKMEPVIGWVDKATGKGIVVAKYVITGRVLTDNDKLNISDISAWIIDGQMGMHFSRKLATGYNPIVNGNAYMVAAKNVVNRPLPIVQHTIHSDNGVLINLINGTVSVPPFQWKPAYTHAVLMYISWGILFPFGILFARYTKHLKHALWFEIHRITQTTGFLVASVGTIGAMLMVEGVHFNTKYHAQLGTAALSAMMYQICSALLRPHVEPKQRKTLQRHIFEWSHHLLGRLGVIAAWVNIFEGFRQLGLPLIFVYTHAGVVGFWVILSIIFEVRLMLERRRTARKYYGSYEKKSGIQTS